MIETEVKGYFITEDGRVWSSKSGRFLKPCRGSNGYAKVSLGRDFQNESVHRLVAEAYCEKGSGFLEVNHKDGNKLNNHYTNLEWVTKSQNHIHKHKFLNPRVARGSSVHSAKLKEEDVVEIEKRIEQGETLTSISKHFGVHLVTVSDIFNQKTWKQVVL